MQLQNGMTKDQRDHGKLKLIKSSMEQVSGYDLPKRGLGGVK